jgi:hypothetical protein
MAKPAKPVKKATKKAAKPTKVSKKAVKGKKAAASEGKATNYLVRTVAPGFATITGKVIKNEGGVVTFKHKKFASSKWLKSMIPTANIIEMTTTDKGTDLTYLSNEVEIGRYKATAVKSINSGEHFEVTHPKGTTIATARFTRVSGEIA